jgi:hypothetical protein
MRSRLGWIFDVAVQYVAFLVEGYVTKVEFALLTPLTVLHDAIEDRYQCLTAIARHR